VSKKKKKKKIKPTKLDITLNKDMLKDELIAIINTINTSYPSQRQIELATKKLFQKLGNQVKSELLDLLQEVKGEEREKILLILMEIKAPELEEQFKNFLNSVEKDSSIKIAVFCILLAQENLMNIDEYPVLLEDGNTLQDKTRDWIRCLEEDKASYGVIEQTFQDLSLTNKILILYFVLQSRGEISIPFLNILSRSNIPKIRWEFALKAVHIQSPQVVPILLRLREDKDSEVRNIAKKTIGILKNKGMDFSSDVRELPIYCCYVGKDIRESGLGTVLIARKFKEHYINYAFFLIDTWGMGLKDVFGENKCHRLKFDRDILPRIKANAYSPIIEEDISIAKKLIIGGVEYARKNGFKVPKEFFKWKDLVGKLTEKEKDYKNLFGKNGEVVVMTSPKDLMRRIVWENNREDYYDERKPGKLEYTFEEVIEKLKSRDIKFVTALEEEVPSEIWEKLDVNIDEDNGSVEYLIREEEEKIEIEEEEEEKIEIEEEEEEKIENEEEEEEKIETEEEEEEKIETEEEEEEKIETEEEEEEKIETEEEEEEKIENEQEERLEIIEKENKEEEKKSIKNNEKSPYNIDRKLRYNEFRSEKKKKEEDFDLEMEHMYDDLEELIYVEEYDRAYLQLEKMLRKVYNTSWEEDILKDLLAFCLDNYDYYDKYILFSKKLETYYKNKKEIELLLITRIDRADYLLTIEKTDEALDIYNNIIKEYPDFHTGLLRLANFYLNADMLAEGVKIYKKIISMKEDIDIEILAEALIAMIDLIDEYNLEGENKGNYIKIAKEMDISITDEPEVILVDGKKK